MGTIAKWNEFDHTIVKKTWGYEKWFANELYCGKELFINRGMCSSEGRFHYHKIKDETFYVLKGKLQIDIIDPDKQWRIDTIFLKKGESFRIKPGIAHRFMAGKYLSCKFIEASTHHEDDDSHYDLQPFRDSR